MNVVVAAGVAGLAPADESLHGEDGGIVEVALMLLLEVVHDLAIADVDDLVGAVGK